MTKRTNCTIKFNLTDLKRFAFSSWNENGYFCCAIEVDDTVAHIFLEKIIKACGYEILSAADYFDGKDNIAYITNIPIYLVDDRLVPIRN